MKKSLIATWIVLALCAGSFARISDIEKNGSWYYLYDEKGKRYKTMSVASVGELKGHSGTFFIGMNGEWYYFFDEKGNRFMTKSVKEIGTIKSVTNSGFTSRNNGFIYTWDMKGRRTGTRPAN